MATSPFNDSEGEAYDSQASAAAGSAPTTGWVPPPGGKSTEPQTLPPLRLNHFFLLMAVLAVYLAISSAYMREFSTKHRIDKWFTVVSVPYQARDCLALTCCGLGLYWWKRGMPFPSEPGHGILLVLAIEFLSTRGIRLVLSAILGPTELVNGFDDSTWAAWVVRWSFYGGFALTTGLYLWLSWWARAARRWQVYFLILALLTADNLTGASQALRIDSISNSSWIHGAIGSAFVQASNFAVKWLPFAHPFATLAVAVIGDYREKVRRHWSHWAGVACWLIIIPRVLIGIMVNNGWLPHPSTPP